MSKAGGFYRPWEIERLTLTEIVLLFKAAKLQASEDEQEKAFRRSHEIAAEALYSRLSPQEKLELAISTYANEVTLN